MGQHGNNCHMYCCVHTHTHTHTHTHKQTTHTIEVCLDGVGKLFLFGGYLSCTAWPCGPVASVML